MKLSALVALLGLASAATHKQLMDDKADLKLRLTALKDLAETVEGGNRDEITQFIDMRQNEIKAELATYPERKEEARYELRSLLNVMSATEDGNMAKAQTALKERKDALMAVNAGIKSDLTVLAADDSAAKDDDTKADDSAAKDDDTKADDTKTDDDQKTEEEPKKGHPWFWIAGVGAAAAVGFVVYKKKSAENEGGDKMDRSLFKRQIKNPSAKRDTKETLVPADALPAEENI
eukprot:CAMPEP_0170481188 /NCGR_PEP_ID=MMETSP0208-20121228/1728_1 /TAXON_ID=197538 /ORGANISM="Strombidium inclinatum, Strain S3" /LENGTH=233 /DNA_ID=CAMNT_0010753849 /DNA_START=24 /DNA_END=725 /DNA_ORIENTATION=+